MWGMVHRVRVGVGVRAGRIGWDKAEVVCRGAVSLDTALSLNDVRCGP